MTAPYLSAHEIRDIAAEAAAALLPTEIATMLPVPLKTETGPVALVVYYSETGRPNQRTVHPPSHAMKIDLVTGKILHFGATTPERLGIRRPAPAVPGAGIPPGLTGSEFADKRSRLLDISRDVWTAFLDGDSPVDAATRDLAREYYSLFLQITKTEVAPFYTGAAKDFFAWLRATAGGP
jgi:hypothetical protein